jgi:lipopolysaccharide export system permease protein
VRRHDRYVLRAYLAALVLALVFLSALVVIYDVADRVDKLPKVLARLAREGRSGPSLVVEYYLTLLPFLWLRFLPVASLMAAGLTFTWLSRQNELVPLVASGVPSLRIVRPVLLAALVLVAAHTVARETVVPSISRRHDDLHRMFQERGRQDRFHEVPHLRDGQGGRLSMAAYLPSERRMEGVWVTFLDAPQAGGRDLALGYPTLVWDDASRRWVADRGGQRRLLSGDAQSVEAQAIPAGQAAPLSVQPGVLELTLRQGAALGLSSAEISSLADAHPDRARFTLLLHQQWAQPAAIPILLLLGLPFLYRLRRGQVFRAFVVVLGAVGAYYVLDSVCVDLGAREALHPVVAAWAAHVVFAALGVVLLAGVET